MATGTLNTPGDLRHWWLLSQNFFDTPVFKIALDQHFRTLRRSFGIAAYFYVSHFSFRIIAA